MRGILQIFFLLLCSVCFASKETEPADDAFDFPECLVESVFKENIDEKLAANDPLDPVLSAECEPLATVAGCVNVLSGNFFQIEKDLTANTIEPLSFTRFYDSGNKSESFLGFGFGSQFPLWASDVEKGARHHYGLISEREGFLLLYRDIEAGPSNLCFIDPRVLKKGYTNLSRAAVSGHANFINWRAHFRTTENAPRGEWIVLLGDGTRRIYDKRVKLDKAHRLRMQFPTETAYLLTREIKPNRNELRFSYRFIEGRHRLAQVESLNSKGALLNALIFDYEKEKCTLKDHYGSQVVYHYQEYTGPYLTPFDEGIEQRRFLQKADSSQKGAVSYETTHLLWKIKHIAKPGSQYLKIDYDPSGKVKALYEPLDNQHPVKRYAFSYHHDRTDVFDALGQRTAYRFDDHQRLSTISYFDGKKPVREDRFVWRTQEGQEGWLRSKSIQTGDEIHYLKTFRYDAKGNILAEALYGNLTGEKPETFTLSKKKEMDRAAIHYDYYPGPQNLLRETSTPEGLSITYAYHSKTNLRTKTLCKYQGSIQERTFCTYDDNGEIVTLIEDDGSSEDPERLENVTYRKIKRITPVTLPCAAFGKPKKISESYLAKTGEEILLKETYLAYDAMGCESEREVYDSQSMQCYTTRKTYDDKLLLRSETNPLGQTIRYEYDENRNKIEEELIGSGKIIHYTYDFGNRLKEKREAREDGQVFTTAYTYNSLDQLVEETDSYSQKTRYRYDRLGNRIACLKPPIKDANGNILKPAAYKKYNVLNQMVGETDEKGRQTTYSYNVYGNPTQITYPDGAKETFNYYPCGWLKEKHQADGTVISYQYDAKGHILNETFLDKNGNKFKSEEYLYKGPLLVSKKDDRGLVTTYAYDGAGRKIGETVEGLKTIRYSYDGFDRLIRKEEEGRVELIDYDGLDRPVSNSPRS